MTDTMKGAVYGIVGTLAAAAIAFIPAWKQYELQRQQVTLQEQQADEARRERNLARQESDALRRQFAEAPKKFVRRFGVLIDGAAVEGARTEGESKLIPYARAIVSQRDALRGELGGLDKLLDSDIDRLAAELAKRSPDPARVREIVETLKAKWKLKEDEIALRIRRLMAALEFLLEAEKLEPAR